MVAPDGGFLDGAVRPLDLPIGPRMLGLGCAMLDAELGAGLFEGLSPHRLSASKSFGDQGRGLPAAALGGEVDAVVGQHGVGPVGTASTSLRKKSPVVRCFGLAMQLDEGEVARAIDGDQHVELTLGRDGQTFRYPPRNSKSLRLLSSPQESGFGLALSGTPRMMRIDKGAVLERAEMGEPETDRSASALEASRCGWHHSCQPEGRTR